MEFVNCRFATFMTVISFLFSETAAYGAGRIRTKFQELEEDIYFIKKDITTLFDKTDQLNMSAVEGCGLRLSGNKTSCPPVTNYDERQNVVEVNSKNVLVKYHSLIKAFSIEKKINRDIQDQLKSVEAIISTSKNIANKIDRDVKSRLQAMNDIISEICNNMTLINIAREIMDNERGRALENQLQSMENTINFRNQALENRLQSLEKIISTRDRELENRLRSSLIATISDKIDEHLPKADTNCTTAPKSGVYTLYPEISCIPPVTVYCDQDIDGGGWIVFMRRQDGSVNFDRSWLEYKHGFGSLDGEFWAGNEFLHKFTNSRLMQLRIDMEDFDGNTVFAMYEEFQVGAKEDKYRLHVRKYSGNAGDSLINTRHSHDMHKGMRFSTPDSDNDNYEANCANLNRAGWWYNGCYGAKLTGLYSYDKEVNWPIGVIWSSWKGFSESLKRVEMKIR